MNSVYISVEETCILKALSDLETIGGIIINNKGDYSVPEDSVPEKKPEPIEEEIVEEPKEDEVPQESEEQEAEEK